MTMTDSDDTSQADGFTDQPETNAVPTEHSAAPELAWSVDDDSDDDEPQRHSWRSAWGIVGIIAACSVVVAGVTGLVLWLARSHNNVPPVAQPTTTVVPPSVSAAPAPTTTTAHASDEANDQLFLRRLATDAFNNNSPEMAGYAHIVCNDLRRGEPEDQVVQWLSSALFSPADTQQQWASLFVNDAKVSYPNCAPTQPPPATVTVTQPPPAPIAPATVAPSGPCYYSAATPECPPKGLTPEQRGNW